MSNKVTLQIVHGEGNIRFGPYGVYLSDFVMTSKGIDRPAKRTFQSIYSWLLRGFRIDQEVYTMSVSVVVSRATEGYFWELMPMDSTAAWRRYVEMAFEQSWPLVIFVSVQEKDTNVSMQTEYVEGPSNAGDVVGPSMQNEENQPREELAMGMADEGERVGIIVDEMEREDSDNEQAEDDASSDEEGDVMATDWANEDFSELVISVGDHVPWEYKENEVIEGARYAHKDEMKEAMKHWAVSLQREFRVVKSTNYVYEVRCMKEDCPWRVHAYKGKYRGQILTIIGCDGNNQVLPMAFAFVESENTESWYWFLERVHIAVDKLDELTTKQTDEQSRRPQVEGDEPPIPLGALHVDPRTMRRKSGSSIRNFTQWIENEPKEKWSLLFDTDGSRYGIMTTNLAKVYNWVMRGVRKQVGGLYAAASVICAAILTRNARRMQKFQGMAYDTPALFNRGIDRNHRSFLSAVEGAQLGTFRPRTSREWLRVDPRHVAWLRAAGLLPLCRLVEAAADDRDPVKRWDADRSLLAALVDCWRPEIHTFHLPCGEMAPTLQDVSYLLGVPLAGAPVRPVDGVFGWKEDITERFEHVMRLPHIGPPNTLPPYSTVGSSKAWLLQFTADLLRPDADDYLVRRSLEAYLLSLFGWVMFTSTHGYAVDYRLVHYARSIADAQPQDVPQWSWGSAVLAATYRALCEACTKTDAGAIFAGCPMLLQLWAAERFAIGRPVVDSAPYGVGRSAQWPEDGPTMGTYWCRRGAYWLTILPMVFDIFVEPHCPQRVMRQFGLRQADAARDISADITAVQVRLNRGLHLTDVEQRVTFDRIGMDSPATPTDFSPLLSLAPRNEPCYTKGPRLPSSAPSVGAVRPTAPVSHGAAQPRGPRLPSSAFAGTTGTSTSSAGAFASTSGAFATPLGAFASSSSHGASIPRPHDGPCPTGFPAGIFGTGASSSHAGRSGITSQFYDDDLHGAHEHDILGSSQLGGAPEAHTQEQLEVTPVQAGRVGRAIPPDRLTYSQGHVRAQGRRDRETRGRRFFQCANFDQTYRPMCNFIECVDLENPQNDGTRAYPRSETRSNYLRRKDEHERRIAAEALEWQVNPQGLPMWRERSECRCGDRCQVIRRM
uniref:Transposon mutator sub-class n=1 Tax=Oryza sativa subsp. indica TaxID=39946 RepID=C5NNP3_ORYSI|nr:transposon mutator sub-class [Oryza sativa Indica Group]